MGCCRNILTNVKGKEQPHDRQGAVYKISCADCQATYRLVRLYIHIYQVSKSTFLAFRLDEKSSRGGPDYAVNITMKPGSKMRGLPWGASKINILLKIFCRLILSIQYNKTLIYCHLGKTVCFPLGISK